MKDHYLPSSISQTVNEIKEARGEALAVRPSNCLRIVQTIDAAIMNLDLWHPSE